MMLLALVGVAFAADIELLHQGRLLDSLGTPVHGTADLTVSLYATESAPSSFWDQIFRDVPLEGGYYAVQLGSGDTSLTTENLTTTPEVWVGVSTDTGGLVGRQRLVETPFAAVATSVRGGSVFLPESLDGCVIGDASTYGELVFADGLLQVCTALGWRTTGGGVVGTYRNTFSGNNDDDTGILPGRSLTFTKQRADTQLRMTWFDGLRVTGSNGLACEWHLRFNGQRCTAPGPLFNNAYLDGPNHHRGTTTTGICSATSAGPIGAGPVTVTIEVAETTAAADCYTGWNELTAYLEAVEFQP